MAPWLGALQVHSGRAAGHPISRPSQSPTEERMSENEKPVEETQLDENELEEVSGGTNAFILPAVVIALPAIIESQTSGR